MALPVTPANRGTNSEHHAHRQRFAVLGKEPTQCVDLFVFSGIDFHGVLLLNLTSKPDAQRLRFAPAFLFTTAQVFHHHLLRRHFALTGISAMRAPHLSARVICFLKLPPP